MYVGPGGEVVAMLLNITTAQTQATSSKPKAYQKSLQAVLTGPGSINATINIYGANVDVFSFGGLLGTLTPNGLNSVHDEITLTEHWPFMWADCTFITGGASLTVLMSA
jgi:hypothetical protein